MDRAESQAAAIPQPPGEITLPASDYFKTVSQNLGLFTFVIDVVITGDLAAHVARQALDGQELDDKIDPATLALKKPGPRTRHLRK